MAIKNTSVRKGLNRATAKAILVILLGVIVACVFGIAAIVELIRAIFGAGQVFASLMFVLAGLFISVVLIGIGVQSILVISRFRKLYDLVDSRGGRMSISQLQTAMDCTREKLIDDLGRMRTRKFLLAKHIDLQRKEIVFENAVPQQSQSDETTILEESITRSRLPLLFAFIGLAIYFMLKKYDSWIDILIPLLLGGGLYMLADHFTPKKVILKEVEEPELVLEKTGEKELDDTLALGQQRLSELGRLGKKIKKPELDAQIQEMLGITRNILEHIQKNPAKVRQARQFINYYLPTTIRLLNEYVELSKQSVKGDNIQQSMDKIENVLCSIAEAFRKELDNLYLDRAIDISADIDVMRGMLQAQGLDAGETAQ